MMSPVQSMEFATNNEGDTISKPALANANPKVVYMHC